MSTTTVAVTTHVIGLGAAPASPPVYIALSERSISARDLLAEHVHAEVAKAQARREGSLALHYMLTADLYAQPRPSAVPLDPEAETARAEQAVLGGQCLLMVDGMAVPSLDATLTLTEQSRVGFVRLMPLIGG